MASESDQFLSDEEFARKLQEQFDTEVNEMEKAEESDRKFAQAVAAGVHDISDSGSDADISVVKVTPRKTVPIKPRARPPIQSQNSSLHSISDSDSDTEDVRLVKENKPSAMTKQNSSLHTISDSDDEIQKVKPKNSPKKQSTLKFSFMKQNSDKDSDETVDLSSDENTDNCQPSTSTAKPPPLKKTSTVHEISDSGSESDSVISPSPTKARTKSKAPNAETKSETAGPSGKKRAHSSDSEEEWGSQKCPLSPETGGKPRCKFGKTCYRKNPSHLKQFWHPEADSVSSPPPTKKTKTEENGKKRNGKELFDQAQPLSFLMTKVEGIDFKYNNNFAINIEDILHPSMGKLVRSVQFNYKIDIPWLVERYPREFRDKPLLIVHGASREEKTMLQLEASKFDNIRLCQAKLEIAYGTHHTKMMFLLYEEGLRIVIHTSNLIHQDWHQKSQGVWISPVFPKMETESATEGDSVTNFKKDILQYLTAYKVHPLQEWITIIKGYNFSSAKAYIIGSVPGRHIGENKTAYGHFKLKKVLNKHGPRAKDVQGWPVIGQFSSVGSMGKDADSWLTGEWLKSLSATKTAPGTLSDPSKAKLNLIYPCKENVRQSLEGYPAGGSLPYSINVAKKQPFLHEFFHQWKSDVRGRSRASPHIKTYTRVSPDYKELSWFLVTSANLSKAAWGALEKSGSQLMIRSYEIGVLFLPQHFGCGDTFKVMTHIDESCDPQDDPSFPLPFDLPLTAYQKGDRPWVWDIPYVDKPDTHGMKWCPR